MGKTFTYILSALVVGIFCGWLIGGRQEVQIKESIKYVYRSATKIDTDLFPEPIKVERIDLPKLQYHDTTFIQVPADTTAILNDYFKRRQYDLDFSTDTTGIYKMQAVICCNRLESASATIVPLQREIVTTIKEVRKFRPYIGGGVALGAKAGASLEVGALLKDHHLPRVGFQRLGKDNYLTIGYGYTF